MNTTNGLGTDSPRVASQRMIMVSAFSVALVLCLILVLFPATGSADTFVSFSNGANPSTGTVSGSTVSGVMFDTILEVPGLPLSGVPVNNFIEAYSGGNLTFTVSGPGNLGGSFSNVTGTFITINETPPTFGGTAVNLLTTVNTLNVSSTLLNDLALSGYKLDPVQSTISLTQIGGNVVSTNMQLAFQNVAVPEASTLSMLSVGLLVAGWLGIRRKKTGPHKKSDFS